MFIVFKRENKTQTISNSAFHLLEIKTIGIYAVSFGSRGGGVPAEGTGALVRADMTREGDLPLLGLPDE